MRDKPVNAESVVSSDSNHGGWDGRGCGEFRGQKPNPLFFWIISGVAGFRASAARCFSLDEILLFVCSRFSRSGNLCRHRAVRSNETRILRRFRRFATVALARFIWAIFCLARCRAIPAVLRRWVASVTEYRSAHRHRWEDVAPFLPEEDAKLRSTWSRPSRSPASRARTGQGAESRTKSSRFPSSSTCWRSKAIVTIDAMGVSGKSPRRS